MGFKETVKTPGNPHCVHQPDCPVVIEAINAQAKATWDIAFNEGEQNGLSLERQGAAYLEGKQAGQKEVVEWAIEERQRLKNKKAKHKEKKPKDIVRLTIIGAKAKTLQQVIDKWAHEK